MFNTGRGGVFGRVWAKISLAEILAVHIIQQDGHCDGPAEDMPNGPGMLDLQLAWHEAILPAPPRRLKRKVERAGVGAQIRLWQGRLAEATSDGGEPSPPRMEIAFSKLDLRPGVNPAYRGPAIVAVAGVVISRSPTKKVANSGSGSYRVAMQTWLSERVVFDPAVCHGKPVVRGTRVLVANVVGAVAAGEAGTEILRDYPSLTEADIQACLEFAGRLTAMEGIEAELAPR